MKEILAMRSDLATYSQSESTSSRDSSLDLFRDLSFYRGHLVSNKAKQPSYEHEVAVISNLLFARFLDAANVANDLVPSSQFDDSAWRIDQESLTKLAQEILPRYSWSLGQNGKADPQIGPTVKPWLLDYLYQRWIDNRETGSYFTPDFLANSIVMHAFHEWITINAERKLGNAERVIKAMRCWYTRDWKCARTLEREFEWIANTLAYVRLVDLSAGGGAFLVSATRLLFNLGIFARSLSGESVSQAERSSLMRHVLANNVYGLDIMQEAVTVAKMRLWLLAIESDAMNMNSPIAWSALNNLVQGNSLLEIFAQSQNAQPSYWSNSTDDGNAKQIGTSLLSEHNFDLCVGNPPFIALSQGNHVSGKTEFINSWNSHYPKYAVKLTSDLSNFFILCGTEVLRDDGILAYITSRNFFDTRYGEPIRRFLTERIELRHIFTLHEHPFIQQGLKVKANTVILTLARRAPQAPARFHHLVSPDQSLVDAPSREVSRAELATSSNWTQTLFENSLRQELTARCKRKLGDYAQVRMGAKTGCNTFFLIRPDAISADLHLPSRVLARAIKNSRDIAGFALPNQTPYRFLNLYDSVERLEQGYSRASKLDPIAQYIYRRGIEYACSKCQSLAVEEHRTHPQLFPHSGMCRKCPVCQKESKHCDRPIDRLSTRGHSPAWYTLALKRPPIIAVQCVVDTEIGVFWNQSDLYVTDQFQVIESCVDEETAVLVFLFLTSRIAHYLLEGICLHRARYDGSFMLKIQVSHLNALPCPDLGKITTQQKRELMRLHQAILATESRRSEHAKLLRDQIDGIYLALLDYSSDQINLMQARLRAELEQAILFRWTKSKSRRANRYSEPEET
jgi:hypothetical protein